MSIFADINSEIKHNIHLNKQILDSSSYLINVTALFYIRSTAISRQHPTYS